MMDWVRVLEWGALVALVAAVVWRLAWLVRTRGSDAAAVDDHQSDDDDSGPDGSRRDTWSVIRYLLASVASTASLLSGDRARWVPWAVTAFLVLAAGPDIMRWLRSARARLSHRPSSN
jgi:hypothetical protein